MRQCAFVLLLAYLSGAWAAVQGAPVRAERARAVARQWLQLRPAAPGGLKHSMPLDDAPTDILAADGTRIGHYFLLPGGGSLVVAADDALPPVLYYSPISRFDPESTPPARTFVEAFRSQLSDAPPPDTARLWSRLETRASLATPTATEPRGALARKGPLLRTRWHQAAPFWNDCPTWYDGRRCLVGCVATTMAQIARYWQYPVHGTGSYCYDWYDGSTTLRLCGDHAAATFEWTRMAETDQTVDPAATAELAELSYLCGISLEMHFSPIESTSGADGVGPALERDLGYAPGSAFISRYDVPEESWYRQIRDQLAAGVPLVFSMGPHVGVVDGYDDATRQVHINLGWGGMSDGWYSLASVPYGWINGTGISLNIRPPHFGGPPRVRSVAPDGLSGDHATIQAALNAASDGDVIVLQPGTYAGWGNRDLDPWGKAVTIRSVDPTDSGVVAATVIDCGGAGHRGFLLHSGETERTVIAGLTITNASAANGWYETDLVPGVGSAGGAILCVGASPTVVNCVLRGNAAGTDGGGVACVGGSSPLLANCIVTGNAAPGSGGGVFSDPSSAPQIVQCDIAGNTAVQTGGVHAAGGFSLSNTILWGNTHSGAAGEAAQVSPGSSATMTHCLVEGWTGSLGGTGNRGDESEPFVDGNGSDDQWGTPDDDLHLRPEAAAIDAGTNAALPADIADLDRDGNVTEPLPFDLDGNPRAWGTSVDIGAIESGSMRDCNGNGIPDPQETDSDGDGVIDACDTCPQVSNRDQHDADSDGRGDVCDDDDDGDNILDAGDNCPQAVNPQQQDSDADGVGDACDNCPSTPNADQADADGNGVGNACEGTVLFVRVGATGAGTGRDWANAFPDLESALAKAERSGGITREIWVAKGTYRPSREMITGLPRSASFQLVSGVLILGGFSGTETTREARNPNPLTNGTILSGDLRGDDLPDAPRWDASLLDNSYAVVDARDTGTGTLLAGFTITGGVSNADGAGLRIRGGDVTIRDCRFIGNRAVSGAGLTAQSAAVRVERCFFSRNMADQRGAGVFLRGGEPVVTHCIFTANVAGNTGGGLSSMEGGIVRSCTFYGNTAGTQGGAIIAHGPLTVRSCILWGSGRAGESNQYQNTHPSGPDIRYCVIQSWSGELKDPSIVQMDPLLVNPAGPDGTLGTSDDDLQLSPTSPCIDVGDPEVPGSGLDLGNKPRLQHCRIDMGAYESDALRDCNGNGAPDACDIAAGAVDCDGDGIPDACRVVSRSRIVVPDGRRHQFALFDGGTGEYIGPLGNLRIRADDVGGLAVDRSRTLYVAVRSMNAVYKLSHVTGAVTATFTGEGYAAPSALLMQSDGTFLLASDADQAIRAFDTQTGAFVRDVIPPGAEGLNGPSAMVFAPEGTLLVASERTNQVFEFDPKTGKRLRVVAEGGGLARPMSLLFGSDGNLLVASFDSSAVLKWARDGTFLGQFIPSESAGLSGAAYLAWGPGGLLVSSTRNDRVLAFDPSDGSPADRDLTRRGVQPDVFKPGLVSQPRFLATISPNECNGNGIPDVCEIASGAATDCNKNDVPDTCEADFDRDGLINDCDDDDDNDGILDDGSGNQVPGDKPCSGGQITGCDDNCPYTPNPDQQDSDGDGRGDVCDRPILVNAVATGANTGQSWQDAYTDLQDALAAARAGQGYEIWVARGTYRPDSGTGDRDAAFHLAPGVGVYGGFSGTEAELRERRPRENITVLSGDLLGNDDGTLARMADNTRHIVVVADTGTSTLLNGFTVQGGYADRKKQGDRGGALSARNASPTIANCTFTGNVARQGGAVDLAYHSSPTFVNCTFANNQAENGGATFNDSGSNPRFVSCLFFSNAARAEGGAIRSGPGCSPLLVNCTVSRNTAATGGGLHAVSGPATVVNSILWGNQHGQQGIRDAQLLTGPAGAFVRTSCIQDQAPGDGDVYPGANNTDADPLFAGISPQMPDAGAFRLLPTSPCIDVATSSVLPIDTMDMDGDGTRAEPLPVDAAGNPRRYSAPEKGAEPLLDLGAIEYVPDCNGNGMPDMCEAACGKPGDPCNRSGCGQAPDCNRNGIPDSCEPDTDLDGIADVCEATWGDMDADGDVDQSDFGRFQRCVSGYNVRIADTACRIADLDFDGDADSDDFTRMWRCATGANVPADRTCNPR